MFKELNKYEQRVVEYENGTFGIQSRTSLGDWQEDFMRYTTEQEAKDKLGSNTVKRVCT